VCTLGTQGGAFAGAEQLSSNGIGLQQFATKLTGDVGRQCALADARQATDSENKRPRPLPDIRIRKFQMPTRFVGRFFPRWAHQLIGPQCVDLCPHTGIAPLILRGDLNHCANVKQRMQTIIAHVLRLNYRRLTIDVGHVVRSGA
jgi:hypothetical protein